MTTQPALLVDCFKIINWLEQRKKLQRDWYNYEKAAEEKLKILLKDQQQYHDSGNQNITRILRQHTIDFHYCDIAEFVDQLLKTKWAENKSLVFGYGDKRVKEWVNLKKFMDNKQIAIVNTAKFIAQGLNFDLPSLDKNVELLDNQMSNLRRKIDFNLNTIYQQQKQSIAQKNKIGLKTFNDEGSHQLSVSEQIPALIKQVPQLFDSVEKKAQQIQSIYDIYVKYCASSGLQNAGRLTLLEKIIKQGNGYVREGEEQIQSKQQKYNGFHEWKPHNQWGIEIEGSSTNNQGQDKMTILQKRITRLELVQDLNQLLYFYEGIKYEQSLKSTLTTLQSESSIQLVQSQLASAIKLIQELLALINGDIATRVELKNNPKAYQILLRKFRNYEQNIQQIRKQNQDYQVQIQQMKIKRQQIVSQLRRLRARLVNSKNQCQKYLTELIKREIRITGEINKLE